MKKGTIALDNSNNLIYGMNIYWLYSAQIVSLVSVWAVLYTNTLKIEGIRILYVYTMRLGMKVWMYSRNADVNCPIRQSPDEKQLKVGLSYRNLE